MLCVDCFDVAEFERVGVMSFYIGTLRLASILGSVPFDIQR